MNWIKCEDRLPDSYCYVLVTRVYHTEGSEPHTMYTFFNVDRELARESNKNYSRKIQGKHSVHFECAEPGLIITHWMPLPPPAKESQCES